MATAIQTRRSEIVRPIAPVTSLPIAMTSALYDRLKSAANFPLTGERLGATSHLEWWLFGKSAAPFVVTVELNSGLDPLPTSLIIDALGIESIIIVSATKWLLNSRPARVARFIPTLRVRSDEHRSWTSTATVKYLRSGIGLGPGLTPSGDDVMMGFLLGARRFGLSHKFESADWSHGQTTTFSATLLDQSLKGFSLRRTFDAIDEMQKCGRIEQHLAALLEIGHTSGLALYRGIQMAYEEGKSI